MVADVLEPEWLRIADQLTKHAVASRQVSDRDARLLVYPDRDEALESPPLLVEDSERGVAGPRELAANLDQAVQHGLELEVGHETPPNFHQAT